MSKAPLEEPPGPVVKRLAWRRERLRHIRRELARREIRRNPCRSLETGGRLTSGGPPYDLIGSAVRRMLERVIDASNLELPG